MGPVGAVPESDTDFIDYYPDGWTEEIADAGFVDDIGC